jgi:peptidoglycan hydrolase-like protein with peptidoglycan-binding domain
MKRARWTLLAGGVAVAAAIGAGVVIPNLASAAPSAAPSAPSGSGVADSLRASGTDVKLVQTDLNGLGYAAGKVDGVTGPATEAATESFQSDRCLGVDGVPGPQTLGALQGEVKQVQGKVGTAATGDYSAATTAAVKKFQGSHHLTVDGIAGADTMKALGVPRTTGSCHNGTVLGNKIVSVAKSQLGTVANGNNCVPGKPYSICADWCAAFATWVWRDAGASIPFETYVPTVYQWAVDHGKWYGTSELGKARPGDLIIFGRADYRYHIGVVDHVSGGTVYVISGNTQNPRNPGQWGVFDKAYPLSGSTFYGLVHL